MLDLLKEKIAKARRIEEELEAEGATVILSETEGTMTVVFRLIDPLPEKAA